MAAWNWLLMSLQNSDINEELSNEKKNEGYYSEDFAYKYIKVNLHDRIEKVGKNDEAKPGQERINVIVRTQIDGCDQDGSPILIKSLNECDNNQNWRK